MTGASLTECIFTRADCSTAVATWSVAFVTGAAFFAAFRAYLLEVDPTLGVTLRHGRERQRADLAIFVVRGTMSIRNVPQNSHQDEFAPVAFDFQNLGRSSLVNLSTNLLLYDRQSGALLANEPVKVGNIAPNQSLRVVLYLLRDPPWPMIVWGGEANRRGGAFAYEASLRYWFSLTTSVSPSTTSSPRSRGGKRTYQQQRSSAKDDLPWQVMTEPR